MGMKCTMSSEEREGESMASQMVKEGFKRMVGMTPGNKSLVSV